MMMPLSLVAQKTQDDFFKALGEVESSNNDAAIGDGGAALGRYQIHKAYWQDAAQHDPSLGGKYEDVVDSEYARRVVLAYLDRYAREAVESSNWETMARVHNGGGSIMKKKKSSRAWRATSRYWEKVKAAMGL